MMPLMHAIASAFSRAPSASGMVLQVPTTRFSLGSR
jgi:hypothetical protein